MLVNRVISVATQTKRRAHIEQEFSKQNIPFEFFDALTPSQELNTAIAEYLPNLANTTLSQGEKACLMSHFILWQYVVQENLPYLGIFEDDVLLGKNAATWLTDEDWLEQRFYNQNCIVRLETFLMPVRTQQTNTARYQNRQFRLLISEHFGTAGYIISRQAAAAIIESITTYLPTQLDAVDKLLFPNSRCITSSTKIYQLSPALCIQELQYRNKHSCLPSGLEQERSIHQAASTASTKPQRNLWQKIVREFNRNTTKISLKCFYRIIPFR